MASRFLPFAPIMQEEPPEAHMTHTILVLAALAVLVSTPAGAQRTRVNVSNGDVALAPTRGNAARLAPRIPGIAPDLAARIRVGGDSAQRIALEDFGWKGRVSSLELDEQDARLFWDVKVVPDATRETLMRYRVDATTGRIMEIKEFTGIRGLARRPR